MCLQLSGGVSSSLSVQLTYELWWFSGTPTSWYSTHTEAHPLLHSASEKHHRTPDMKLYLFKQDNQDSIWFLQKHAKRRVNKVWRAASYRHGEAKNRVQHAFSSRTTGWFRLCCLLPRICHRRPQQTRMLCERGAWSRPWVTIPVKQIINP